MRELGRDGFEQEGNDNEEHKRTVDAKYAGTKFLAAKMHRRHKGRMGCFQGSRLAPSGETSFDLF
jgi:hypothetical protein